MPISYAEGAVEKAKKEKLHLIKCDIMGKHAGCGSMSFSGPVGPRTAAELKELFTRLLCDQKERMK